MRSYIFTPLERRLVDRLLRGERDEDIWKLMYRMRQFGNLRSDVRLYLRAAEIVLQKEQLSHPTFGYDEP